MLEEEEEELDDETIQARVDASLAKIYSVTSTWLKPKKTPSVPKTDFQKELEEIMRRPARLGVGAELPEKQTQSGLSDMKLKNKMLGKKRERETTNSNDATPSAHEDGEEESKSRARVIHKKPRVDPFASTRKKGKGVNVPAMVSFNKLAGSPPAFETKSEKERVVATPHIDQNTPGPSSSTNASRTALTYEPTHETDESEDEEGERQPAPEKVEAIPKSTLDLLPVLNLHGPPVIRDDTNPSPKKKRRKKKKKKHHLGGEAGPPVPVG